MGYKDKAKMTEYNRQYYLKHKESELARNKLFVAKNRKRVLQKKKERHAINAELERKQKRDWYYAKQAERIAYSVEWRKKNPQKAKDIKRIATQNRRAKERDENCKLSRNIKEKLYELQNGICVGCRKKLGEKYHLDHIMPIALGGKTKDENIQLLCVKCNSSKHAKHPVDFMRSRGFLL